MSRGSPTFTDSSRAIPLGIPRLHESSYPQADASGPSVRDQTVRNYCLTRLKTQLHAVEVHRDYVRLERHESGNASDFGISLTIRPCRKTCVGDVVITAQAFVRTEGLMFHESQRGLIDVGARDVVPTENIIAFE